MPSTLFLMIVSFFEKNYDFDITSFLLKRDLKLESLRLNNSTIKAYYLYELVDEVMKKTNDYSILYKLGKLASPNRMGILGYLMIHSNTVFDALDKLCKYYLLIGKNIKPIFAKVEEGYKIAIFSNNEKGDILNLAEYSAQIHLFAIMHLINNIIPNTITPKYITFSHKKPHVNINENKIDDIKIYFEQEENALYFSEDIKNIMTSASNEYLVKVFEKEAEETLKLKLNEGGFKEKISGLILISSTQLDISLDSIAARAGVHPRSLQMRLKEEGTTFSEVLTEVRKKLSIYYLSKEIPISTISISLGYIELSSFFRAFKKWYKKTPKQWFEENNK